MSRTDNKDPIPCEVHSVDRQHATRVRPSMIDTIKLAVVRTPNDRIMTGTDNDPGSDDADNDPGFDSGGSDDGIEI